MLLVCFCILHTLSPLPNRDSNDKVKCRIWKVYHNIFGLGYVPSLENCESIKCFIDGYEFFSFPFLYFHIKFSKQPSPVDHRPSLHELRPEASYCISLVSRIKQLFIRKTHLFLAIFIHPSY